MPDDDIWGPAAKALSDGSERHLSERHPLQHGRLGQAVQVSRDASAPTGFPWWQHMQGPHGRSEAACRSIKRAKVSLDLI